MSITLLYSLRKQHTKGVVCSNVKKKMVGEKYLDDLLLLLRFWSTHSMYSLLCRVANGTDAGSRSDNMVDLVFLNFIHTTHIYTTLNIFNAFKSNVVPARQ